jgi:hypothetical protein
MRSGFIEQNRCRSQDVDQELGVASLRLGDTHHKGRIVEQKIIATERILDSLRQNYSLIANAFADRVPHPVLVNPKS